MKKYSYFIFEPEYHDFLVKIRDLGVIHVKERNSTKEVARFQQNAKEQEELKELERQLRMLRAANKLEEDQDPSTLPHRELPEGVLTDYQLYVQSIRELEGERSTLESQLSTVRGNLEALEPWGDFDPALIAQLQDSGHHIHFWQVPHALYDEAWEEEHTAILMGTSGRYAIFVTVSRSSEAPVLPNAERLHLPPKSISMYKVEERTILDELERIKETLIYLAYNNDILEVERTRLQNLFNFDNANYQGSRMFEDKLVILEGFVPERLADEMEQALTKDGFAYVPMELTKEENVPVQLNNSRFARVFEPIIKMFSTPNYWEIDPTPYVAPFFLLFFGICFGDSGYGLLVLIVTSLLKPKAKESAKPLLELGQWLGLAGLVIGFLSGSFFGISLVEVPWLVAIKDYFISSENMMVISVAIGFVHVIFGKYVGAYKKHRQEGLRQSLASYAWPTIILLAGVLILLPMLNLQMAQWLEYTLLGIAGLSVLIVLFYNSPGKNIFLNLGTGLWDTYNNASGLIGDVLSYIRLFAIGLTGAVLGQVFNNLAMMVTDGMSILPAILVGGIILLLGHSVNFGLTTIGALVHPIRLIYVEYFGNSEFEGSGLDYNPLREITPEK